LSAIAVACVLVLKVSRDFDDNETVLSYLGASEEYAASKIAKILFVNRCLFNCLSAKHLRLLHNTQPV
jgi:hypothetical protein